MAEARSQQVPARQRLVLSVQHDSLGKKANWRACVNNLPEKKDAQEEVKHLKVGSLARLHYRSSPHDGGSRPPRVRSDGLWSLQLLLR